VVETGEEQKKMGRFYVHSNNRTGIVSYFQYKVDLVLISNSILAASISISKQSHGKKNHEWICLALSAGEETEGAAPHAQKMA
jgi:catalase (peroxidase I)